MVSNTAGFIFLIPKHDPCNDVSITDEVTNDGTDEIQSLKKIQIHPVSVLRLQLKKSLNIALDLQRATISVIQSMLLG